MLVSAPRCNFASTHFFEAGRFLDGQLCYQS